MLGSCFGCLQCSAAVCWLPARFSVTDLQILLPPCCPTLLQVQVCHTFFFAINLQAARLMDSSTALQTTKASHLLLLLCCQVVLTPENASVTHFCVQVDCLQYGGAVCWSSNCQSDWPSTALALQTNRILLFPPSVSILMCPEAICLC